MSLAGDILDGFSCSYCGVCFEKKHGYPVLCKDCWKNTIKSMKTAKRILDKLGFQKAFLKEL